MSEDGFRMLAWTRIDIDQLQPEWARLAENAAVPNCFFEPWFLMPSLTVFDPEGDVSLAMLVEGGRLRALMPVCDSPTYHGRALRNTSAWLHANMFCGLPLMEPGFERAFWQAYLAALDERETSQLFAHLPQMPEDCAATKALLDVCHADGRQIRVVHREERAALNRGKSPEAHFVDAMSNKRRKELRRLRKRFDECGTPRLTRHRGEECISEWIDTFLALEKSGWKGEQGSALACDPQTERLFRAVISGAAKAGKLERLALYLDDKPIAMLATFLSHPGGFAFKTAFDENYARFSPGMMLQVDNLALLDDPELAWCDSCAAADHPMIERIWRDRRSMVWLTVSAGRGWRRAIGSLWARAEAWRMERRT